VSNQKAFIVMLVERLEFLHKAAECKSVTLTQDPRAFAQFLPAGVTLGSFERKRRDIAGFSGW
jgi:hypothetical protein